MKSLAIMMALLIGLVIGLLLGATITSKAYQYPTLGEGYKTHQTFIKGESK